MKKLILPLLLLVAIGCASLETNAYRTIGSVAVTVDTAMNGWGLYVRQHSLTEAQQKPVKDAYLKYQAVMAAVQGEVNVYHSVPANSTPLQTGLILLSASATNVLETINSFPK